MRSKFMLILGKIFSVAIAIVGLYHCTEKRTDEALLCFVLAIYTLQLYKYEE